MARKPADTRYSPRESSQIVAKTERENRRQSARTPRSVSPVARSVGKPGWAPGQRLAVSLRVAGHRPIRSAGMNPFGTGYSRPVTDDTDSPVTITPYEDGPLLVRGEFEIRSADGEIIDPGRSVVALCRCGLSAVKPFCDGTHKVRGFRAPAGDRR